MTKTIPLFVFFALFRFSLFSQNVGINVSGNAANSKALLDVDVTGMNPKAGLLLPRMTTAERDAISTSGTTPESLLIYNTTTHCFESYYNGTWVAFGCIGCQLPGTFSASNATNVTATSFSANWTTSSGATGYFLDVSTSNTFASFVTGYNNLSVGNVVTYSVNTNLTCNTTYYYRVRANNSCGTSANSLTISQPTSFCACTYNSSNSFTDARDGKNYSQVQIGTQCWMAENLNYGTYVPVETGQTGAGTQKYCYGDNTANCTTYGGLYEWDEMMNGSVSCNGTAPPPDANAKCATPVQGICPSGWHVPSHYEWTLLERSICTSGSCATDFPYDISSVGSFGTDEGSKLKQTGTTNWTSPNTATNNSGFTALPGGASWSGSFYNIGNYGKWWSATEYLGTYAFLRKLIYDNAKVIRDGDFKTFGHSCRCVKD